MRASGKLAVAHLGQSIFQDEPADAGRAAARGGGVQLAEPAEVRARARDSADELHEVQLEVARRQKLRDGLALRLVRLALPRSRGVDVQGLQTHAVRSNRVGDETTLDLELFALA